MIFSSLPFDGIPPHSSPHPLPADFSWQPINRDSRISRFLPLGATTFLWWFSLGFVTPDPVLLTSYAVLRLRSDSVVFAVVTPLRPTGHYFPISLLFHSSPSPATGGPGDTNNTPPRQAAPLSPGLLHKPHTRCVILVRVPGESFR